MNITNNTTTAICRQHRDLFMRSVTHELSPAQAMELQDHLRECQSCRTWVDDYSTITNAMAGHLAYATPPPRVVTRIIEHAQPPHPHGMVLAWLLRPAIAAAAVVLITGIWIGNNTVHNAAIARQGQRAQQIHALAALLSDQEDGTTRGTIIETGEDSLRALAHQLLVLQGVENMEIADTDDAITPTAGMYPTTPQDHNISAFPSASRV